MCCVTKTRCSALAAAETFHFAIRISHGTAARLSGALKMTRIIRGAIPHAALYVPLLIHHRAAPRFGTKHLAVLIHRALPFSAHYISILVLDAIRGIDLGTCGQG